MTRTDTRLRIELAAIAVLAEFGMEGFTASRLAETSGVSKANLYHHFSSLDEIVLASFERLVVDMQMMQPPDEMGFADWLEGLGEELILMPPDRLAAMRAYLAFFVQALAEGNLRGKLLGALHRGHHMLAQTLLRFEDGLPASGIDVDHLARLILVSGDGFLLHALMLEDRAEELRPAWALFVQAILAQGKPS